MLPLERLTTYRNCVLNLRLMQMLEFYFI